MSVPAGEARARAEATIRRYVAGGTTELCELQTACSALLADFDRLTAERDEARRIRETAEADRDNLFERALKITELEADRDAISEIALRNIEQCEAAEARVAALTETLEQIIRSCAATLGPDGVHPALVVGNISTRARAALAGGSTAAPDEAKTPCSECGNTGDNFFGGEHGEAFALCGKCGHRWDPLAGSAVEPPEREQ